MLPGATNDPNFCDGKARSQKLHLRSRCRGQGPCHLSPYCCSQEALRLAGIPTRVNREAKYPP